MPDRDPEFVAKVLESLGGFIYVYDLADARNVFISPRWGEEFGYSREETMVRDGALLPRIIHPVDLELVQHHHAALRDAPTDEVRTLEYRVLRKGGEYAWVCSVDRPMERDGDGRVRSIVGHAHDITAHKQAALAEAESRAGFEAIVRNLPDAVFIADAEARIMQVNDAACAQVGYPREALLAMRIPDVVAPEYRGRVRERLTALPGSATARQSAHLHRDGTVIPVETVVVGIELEGKPAFLGVARDIRERIEMEARLRDGQRMEAIGRLAGAVAHDFNNILMAIMGSAEFLGRRQETDAEGREIASEIAAAAHRGAELTRQLLTFGRRQRADPEPCIVSEIVEDTLLVVQRLLDGRHRLERSLTPSLMVTADRGMLAQVVMNLALNARDATPDGGTITVTSRSAPDRDGMVELSVTDSGEGIDPKDLPRIFEPFYTTKEDGGSGIGLATVYGIVQQHGGEISVQSTPGAGSCFRVLLPRTAGVSSRRAPATGASTAGGTLTVLLVDDMADVRRTTGMLLEGLGHRVLPAATPRQARERIDAEGEAVDVLVSDIALGTEEDGPALAAALRAMHPTLRVVFISGHPAPEALLELVPGAVFLQKPFSTAQLQSAIDGS